MKIIGPLRMKFTKSKVLKIAIKEINKYMKKAHGLFSFCELAVINDDLPLDFRNRIAQIYLKKGWKYVYHITKEEMNEAIKKDKLDIKIEEKNTTSFLFSQKEITEDQEPYIKYYTLVKKEKDKK